MTYFIPATAVGLAWWTWLVGMVFWFVSVFDALRESGWDSAMTAILTWCAIIWALVPILVTRILKSLRNRDIHVETTSMNRRRRKHVRELKEFEKWYAENTTCSVVSFKGMGSVGESCAICLNEFCETDECRKLPCGHEFHKECVDEFLLQPSKRRDSRHRKCPMCRFQLGDLRRVLGLKVYVHNLPAIPEAYLTAANAHRNSPPSPVSLPRRAMSLPLKQSEDQGVQSRDLEEGLRPTASWSWPVDGGLRTGR